jgi:hypothetical protein
MATSACVRQKQVAASAGSPQTQRPQAMHKWSQTLQQRRPASGLVAAVHSVADPNMTHTTIEIVAEISGPLTCAEIVAEISGPLTCAAAPATLCRHACRAVPVCASRPSLAFCLQHDIDYKTQTTLDRSLVQQLQPSCVAPNAWRGLPVCWRSVHQQAVVLLTQHVAAPRTQHSAWLQVLLVMRTAATAAAASAFCISDRTSAFFTRKAQ